MKAGLHTTLRPPRTLGNALSILEGLLRPLDYGADLDRLTRDFYGREWLFEALGVWLRSNADPPLFWIVAPPGAGKSAIAAMLMRTHGAVLSGHFFGHADSDRTDPRRALCSVAYQLAVRIPEYCKILVSSQELVALQSKNAHALFRQLIAEPLRSITPPGEPRIIVLDAIDEATGAHEGELAEVLGTGMGLLPEWVRLVATSRRSTVIAPRLSRVRPFILDGADPHNRRDIEGYLRAWVGQGVPEQELTAIVGTLAAKSEGLFLYVREVRREVEQGHLSLESPDQFPPGLSGVYTDFFQRYFPQASDYSERCRPLLELALAALEPLPCSLAREVLGWNDYEEAALLQWLAPILSSRDGRLYPFHRSVLDWLSDPQASLQFHASQTCGRERFAAHLWRRYRDGPWRLEGYALKHLVSHLLLADQLDHAKRVLQNFGYLMAKCREGFLSELFADYGEYLQVRLPTEADVRVWQEFLLERAHLLRRADSDWGAHKILLQLAIEHADESPLTQAAEAWLEQGDCDWLWLRNPVRPRRSPRTQNALVIEAHNGRVEGVLLCGTGRVVSWADDNSARVWDYRTGACLGALEGHTRFIQGMRLLPNGLLLSWAWDCTLRLWDPATLECRAVLSGHQEWPINALPLHGNRLISWAADKSVRVWEATTGASLAIIRVPHHNRFEVTLLPHGNVLTWSRDPESAADNMICAWDTLTGMCKRTLTGHPDNLAAVLPLENNLVICSHPDGSTATWDLRSGACLSKARASRQAVKPECTRSFDDNTRLCWAEGSAMREPSAAELNDDDFEDESLPGLGDKPASPAHHFLWLVEIQEGRVLARFDHGHDRIRGAMRLPDGRVLSWGGELLRIWDPVTSRCDLTLGGHSDSTPILGATSISARTLASWNWNELLIWDLEKGTCISALRAHRGAYGSDIRGAVAMPDSRLLSWGGDGTLRAWSIEPTTLAQRPEGHQLEVNGVLVIYRPKRFGSNDGLKPELRAEAISWSADGMLVLWDCDTAQAIRIFAGHDKAVIGARLLPTGDLLSWSEDCSLRIWDLETGLCKKRLTADDFAPTGATMLNSGKIAAWQAYEFLSDAATDITLRVWDPDNEACSQAFAGMRFGASYIEDLSELPGGALLSRSRDRIHAWNPHTQGCVRVVDVCERQRAAEGNPKADPSLLHWCPSDSARVAVLAGHDAAIQGTMPLRGRRLLSWGYDETLRVWDAVAGLELAVCRGHSGAVAGAVALPGARILSWAEQVLFGGCDTVLRIWDESSGSCLQLLSGHTDAVLGAARMTDSTALSWGRDRTIRLWNTDSGQCLAVMGGHTDPVGAVIVLPEGRIASWCKPGDLFAMSDVSDYAIRIWSPSSAQCLQVLDGHSAQIRGVSILPDGSLVSWSADNSLRVWDLKSGECVAVLEEDDSEICGVLILRDGRIASWDSRSLRIWDVSPYRLVRSWSPPTGVSDVSSMPDGRLIVAGGGQLAVYDPGLSLCLRQWCVGRSTECGHVRLLPDGRILTWTFAAEWTLRISAADADGLCMLGGMGVVGVSILPSGHVVSNSRYPNDPGHKLEVWDPSKAIPVESRLDASERRAYLAFAQASEEADSAAQSARILTASGERFCAIGPRGEEASVVRWHADEKIQLHQVLSDGTLAATLASGAVAFPRLYRGKRRDRLSADEA